MGKIDWQKNAALIICAAAGGAILWLFFKYIFAAVLPFLVAYAVAIALAPAAGWISKKTKIPIKLCSAVLLLAAIGLMIFIIVLLANRLIYELKRLSDWLISGESDFYATVGRIAGELGSLGERIPILRDMRGVAELEAFIEGVDDMIIKLLTDFISKLSMWVPEAIFRTISRLPGALLLLTVTIVACFYFCVDLAAVNSALLSLLPRRAAERVPAIKSRVFSTVGRWIRAYLVLFGITFIELFLGFSILGVNYPLLIALIGAFVDILPFFGTGTILIPWGLIALLSKDFRLGFGLIILYAVTLVVRQIAEPRVVGGSFGIHPLLALAAMYTGFKLFGFLGMIIFPALLMMIKNVFMVENEGNNNINVNNR